LMNTIKKKNGFSYPEVAAYGLDNRFAGFFIQIEKCKGFSSDAVYCILISI
jgi:hypothetical protein